MSIKERIVLRGIQPSKIKLYHRGNNIAQNTKVFDDIHDVLLDDNFYYLVGTSGNEIFQFNRSTMKEVQRWNFSGEKDAQHINCLAKWNGSIIFSAFGEFNEHCGYKGKTKKSGFVQNLHTGHRLITGLSQPHSLASIGQNLLLANSENKELLEYGPTGNLIRTLTLDGYTRGIFIFENIIYIGLSCQRTIESLGIGKAAVIAIDRDSWVELGTIYLPTSEIYAIQGLSDRDDVIHILANIASTTSNSLVAERDGQVVSLNDALAERDQQITTLSEEIAHITSSTSWRVTLPIREAKRWLLTPKIQVQRYLMKGLPLLKKWYQAVPLSYQTKEVHRNVLGRYFPNLLLVSSSLPPFFPALVLTVMKQIGSPTDFAKKLIIPVSQNPIVSVIIPVYGQIDYTLRCLASIAENQPQVAFEVIVVDDCSPDNSIEVLANIKGIRLICKEQNQGFIRSCNAAANVAEGEYLYFLNNDTQVMAGWLDELLRTFSEFPGTGLAGSKLVYPDGRLQEAGCIIWQDGSAWNFGRLQDPLVPVYNYAREVDYCSGASIMVPKALFDELGGFDDHYLPAYCEDSDLALKIRENGYRVIYQPLSTVFHFEGITSGTDTTQGTKAYQIDNMKKVYERWKSRLQTHQPNSVDVDSAKDRCSQRRVLFIDSCTPTPDQDSGSIDSYNLMLLLREMKFQVTFIPEDNFLYMQDYTMALQRAGIEVLYAPYYRTVTQHLKEVGDRYDLAFLCRPLVADHHLQYIRRFCPKAKILFHTVDLHFVRLMREAELSVDKSKLKAAHEMKQLEFSIIAAADMTTVISTEEHSLLLNHLPNMKIKILPYSRHIVGTKIGFYNRSNIVFIGSYQHRPNISAVMYFVSEIMPLLRIRLPSVCFYVVGSKVTPEIQALATEDVIITGFVEDLNSFLDKMRISVAPLLYGAGIKGKIGSAMAVGLPVVATPLAVEGMSLSDGENILVADGAEAFADAITKLYKDEALWNRLSHSSLAFADKAWGAEAAWNILHEILEDISMPTVRGSYPLSLYSEPKIAEAGTKKL